MNKAVTEGLILMPPPFADGLNVWSSGNGTPGSSTYDGAANAAFVPSDPDFGGCLELIKTEATQRLRWMGQVPVLPGLYLRVTVRIKVLSGALPAVRIAGFAANSGGGAVAGVTTQGPSVALDQFGKVFTVSAIIGTGPRGGVNMNWAGVAYGHLGLDLTGANGGVVRIDDIQIEDVTAFYLRDMMDWVDVRDHGAVGDGVTDDRPAFLAAASEASGKGVSLLVPEGSYFIGSTLTIEVPVRFQGTLVMDDDSRLQLSRSFDFPSYAAAFGDDDLGFRKGVQALFHFTDHVSFDLRGRRVRINGPVDLSALSGLTAYAQRRQICNGQIEIVSGSGGDFAGKLHHQSGNAAEQCRQYRQCACGCTGVWNGRGPRGLCACEKCLGGDADTEPAFAWRVRYADLYLHQVPAHTGPVRFRHAATL